MYNIIERLKTHTFKFPAFITNGNSLGQQLTQLLNSSYLFSEIWEYDFSTTLICQFSVCLLVSSPIEYCMQWQSYDIFVLIKLLLKILPLWRSPITTRLSKLSPYSGCPKYSYQTQALMLPYSSSNIDWPVLL